MYCLNDISELTNDKLKEIINNFNVMVKPQLTKWGDYYKGKQNILNKQYEDKSKPCNKIVTNYCLDIVDNYEGYLTGKAISYSSNEDISDIQSVLNYNDVKSEDSKFLKNALIYGKAFEVCYIDEDKQQRFKLFDSRNCIDIYDSTLDENLIAVVRFWLIDELQENKGYYLEVYTDTDINTYKCNTDFTSMELIKSEPHYYKQVPITVFKLNDDSTSIFDCIMTLQDAYNTLLSSEVDDYEAFVDCMLVLKGCDAEEEDLVKMKTARTLILDTDSNADYLTKEVNDTQIENMVKRINDAIHKIAKSPDFNDDKFMAQSGEAMKYKMIGFENRASSIESQMKMALQKRFELISAICNLSFDNAIWRDIKIQFTRNLPVNLTEIVSLIPNLRGFVSDSTLLSLLPFIEDVNEELEKIEQEKPKVSSYFDNTDNEDIDE